MKNNKIMSFEKFNENHSEGLSPEKEISLPVIYSIMTKELENKLKDKGVKHISIADHGYSFECDTIKKFEKIKGEYKKGEKYKGETITAVYY